jgi:hypothetical protein
VLNESRDLIGEGRTTGSELVVVVVDALDGSSASYSP